MSAGVGPASGRPRVEVALPLPVDQTFTYAVEGSSAPAPGSRVLVPFRRSERIGWVIGPGDPGEVPGLRLVHDVLDARPSLSPEILELARWIADYYAAPLGVVLRTVLPSLLSDRSRDSLRLVERPERALTPRERAVVDALSGARARTLGGLRKALGDPGLRRIVRRLVEEGAVERTVVPPTLAAPMTRKVVQLREWIGTLEERDRVFGRARRQREAYERLESAGGSQELSALLDAGFSRSVVTGLEEKGLAWVGDEEVVRDPFAELPVGAPEPVRLTPAQETAVRALGEAFVSGSSKPFLLHGITGSGKTQVYIELLRRVVDAGQSGIVLVPEISLTPQTVQRFRSHFGDQVAVLHSALSEGERYDAWRQLRSGEKRIAVGARSAIFAPVERLGAVVVDEEHDASYKQSEAPRYHARDLAVVRAAQAGAVCVLGSATPSLESWRNVELDKFERLVLPRRATGASLPPVVLVDLREVRAVARKERARGRERRSGREGSDPPPAILSPLLVEKVEGSLARGEQVILLLNRRGYSNFVQCLACGEVRACPNCAVSLTFHRARNEIVCHHCHHREPAPRRCARCDSDDLSFRGLGTEQVERVVWEAFPRARLARMDVDTTGGKWSHHEILRRFGAGEIEILLGTQMIAKGLDFPNVTLVGVINADVGMHLPDFRASERTFQLLSQVAGRAGRGERVGEVVIQSSLPEHYAVQAAVRHEYEAFARRELKERSDLSYPPFTRMTNVVVSSPDPDEAATGAATAASWTRKRIARTGGGIDLLGPAPSPIERLHGRWRWHFLLRSRSHRRLGEITREVARSAPAAGSDLRVVVDRDPVALL